MGEFFFAIAVIVAIVRGIFRFFRWVSRSLRGASAPVATPPAPPRPTNSPQDSSASAAGRGRPAPMPRPPDRNTPPPLVVSREATTAGFRDRETRLQAAEPSPFDAPRPDEAVAPSATSSPLFGSTSDLVRALILQEVLGPPLSKRRPPPG